VTGRASALPRRLARPEPGPPPAARRPAQPPVVGAAAGAGAGNPRRRSAPGPSRRFPDVPTRPRSPAGLPAPQHAWERVTSRSMPNGQPGRPAVLTGCCSSTFVGDPAADRNAWPARGRAAGRLEARSTRGRPSGLLFTVAWGPGYFTERAQGPRSPVPAPRRRCPISSSPVNRRLPPVACHLASDDESRGSSRSEGRARSGRTPPPDRIGRANWASSSVLCAGRQSRNGIRTGAGLPASRQDVKRHPRRSPGAPGTRRCSWGFKSGLRAQPRPAKTT